MAKRVVVIVLALAIALGSLSLAQPQQALAGSMNAPVLFIHGYNAGSAINCNTGTMWGDTEQVFNNQGYWNWWSIGFYNGDSNCDAYLSPEYSHCTGWYDSGSNDGTVNEDIRHTTCLLAWYIWDHYTQYGTTIAVVAHSMGGILIRQAMFDTPYVGAFPPYLKISDVATAGSPHEGLADGAAGYSSWKGCPGNCIEVYQMQWDNPLMANLNSTSFRSGFGRNPQGSGGTDWTNMASNFDEALSAGGQFIDRQGAPSNVNDIAVTGFMPGATHFVVYPGSYPYYNHGGYLTDENTTWNADESYSDNNGGTWYTVSNSEHSIITLYYAILYSSW